MLDSSGRIRRISRVGLGRDTLNGSGIRLRSRRDSGPPASEENADGVHKKNAPEIETGFRWQPQNKASEL